MKFKKILTCLLLALLSLTGFTFGCKNKYANLKIEVNGESNITLTMNSGDDEQEKEVAIKIFNAPNEACKVISYSMSKPNIVTVTKLQSTDSNIARFKISALENITSYDPSVVITFKTAEGDKTCDLFVNVKIPVTSISINKNYKPYVVADGNDYYINTSTLINFQPHNTTERDIEYSLVEPNLQSDFGVELTSDGKISVQKYISESGVALNEIKVNVASKSNPLITKEATIKVYRDITANDVVFSLNLTDTTNNIYQNNFTGLIDDKTDINYINSISYLMEKGIMLASNVESQRNIDFGVFLDTRSGLDFDKVSVSFETTTLNNAIIESTNDGNTNKNLSKFKIYSVNPNLDILIVTLKYKEINDYSVSFSIPVNVREFPISLIVNNSENSVYNIFDYYAGSDNGQAFNVKIAKAGAFDKTYKVSIDKTDFDLLEIRYQYEILDYETLTSLNFTPEAVLYVKAKTLDEPKSDVKITFTSNTYSESYANENLTKTISLNLNPGIRMLSYDKTFAENNEIYLENGKSINLNYLVNSSTNSALSGFVKLNITKGSKLVEISQNLLDCSFTITSLGVKGDVELNIYSENGLEIESKIIHIYNYDENAEDNLKIDLSSQNIKKVIELDTTKYFIGLSSGQNMATITITNPFNASIYAAEIESEDDSIIGVGVVDKDELRFYVNALKKSENPIKITIKVTLFNNNDEVNTNLTQEPLEFLINLNTYNPIQDINVKVDEIIVVDGIGLDIDSLTKGLNILNVEKYLEIIKADNDLSNLSVDYIMPSSLTNGEDYIFEAVYEDEEKTIEKPFKQIKFTASKNHLFINGEYNFSFTVRIEDLPGSNEYHLINLKVKLIKHTAPDGIKILNENGYVYLENTDSIGQIRAEVYSNSGKEVTNKTLEYKKISGNSVDVDLNGVVTIKTSGITEVEIRAKASQYQINGDFSAVKKIFIVVADGSKSYPYILKDVSRIRENKHYTLDKDINVKSPIETKFAGINGKFVYSKYSNINNKEAIYNFIYEGELNNSIFGKEISNKTTIENLKLIVANSKTLNIESNFGVVAGTNNGLIKNVDLLIQSLNFNINKNDIILGLMFAENNGELKNCSVSGNATKGYVIINNANNYTNLTFGGLVAINNNKIVGNYSFIEKTNFIASNLNVKVKFEDSIVGGLVGKNAGIISNIATNVILDTNSKLVGGLVGKFDDTNTHKNLMFNGSIYSSNQNSIIGGVAGIVENANFELIFTEFANTTQTTFGANIKGATVGGLFGKVTNSTIKYAFVNSLVSFNDYFDLQGAIVGGLVAIADKVTFEAVYSDISLNGTNVGALVYSANNSSIKDAYSYSTGANALVEEFKINDNKILSTNEYTDDYFIETTYSTTCNYVFNENGKDILNNNYTKLNYSEVLSIDDFKTGNFVYKTNLNNGLPYLVYNGTGLITIEPQNISANFVVKNKVENSSNYYYGSDENVIVINDDNSSNKAIIYFDKNLTYNVDDLINLTLYPSNADTRYITFTSSNTNVVVINENGLISIIGLGNSTINISYLNKISTNVYISVVEKAESLTLTSLSGEDNNQFNVLKNKTKEFGTIISGGNSTGIYFEFENDVKEFALFNNNEILEKEIYSYTSTHIFKGLKDGSSNFVVAPYYSVNFGGENYNFIDYLLIKNNLVLNVNVGATAIYSDIKVLELIEDETISFNVFVKDSCGYLDFKNGEFANYLDISTTIATNSSTIDVKNFVVTVVGKKTIENKTFIVEFYDKNTPDLILEIEILLKSAKLISVELNHYSSNVTYFDDYNSVITPESLPNSEIVAGNLGVLNINLYPSFAKLDRVEVISSSVNNVAIGFNQLAYNNNEKLFTVTHKAALNNGIVLDVNKSIYKNNEFKFNGNLYVSTLLPTNVVEDTIFTITVICYFNQGAEPLVSTLNLKAKPLTSLVLSNLDGSHDTFLLAKGAELKLLVEGINLDENAVITGDNFIVSNSNIEKYYHDGILTLSTDILTASGTIFTVTPKFNQYINGKYVEAESNPITVQVVDFVVKNVTVQEIEDGILNNNLGNSILLKAQLDVIKCEENYNINTEPNKALALSNINFSVSYLEEMISKAYSSWNVVTQSTGGNQIYTNLVDGGNYTNFNVSLSDDGYLLVTGKNISTNQMLLKVNISYKNGIPALDRTSDIEIRTNFVLNIKAYSSSDHPIPVTTYEEFVDMEKGQNYILLNDITLPSTFTGISTEIASFDGNNKIINLEGFTIDNTNVTNLGLFNTISQNTVIKNVTVNVMPTLYYSLETYYFGLNINAQNLTELNFGIISGTNNGVITNCKVINNNTKIVNNVNQYKNITVNVNASESVKLNVGLISGVNSGYISNSKVGDLATTNTITLTASGNIGGLTAKNDNKIASSFVVNTIIYNNAKTKQTGGFVAENNGQIITSYVEGNHFGDVDRSKRYLDGGVYANAYIGGFVNTNNGNIKDCYSNIKVSTNKRSAGFVYDNTNGTIETCYSASVNGGTNAQAFRYFTGNNEENIVLNNEGIKYCYYAFEDDLNGSDNDEYSEPAHGILSFDDAKYFEGFISDNTSSTIWVFNESKMPTLYDANIETISERRLIDEQNKNGTTEEYNYIYINGNYNIGTKYNPIIVSSSQELLNALTDSNNLYSYYFNGRIQSTKINYNHIRLVKDIDLSTIIDANNNVHNSTSEVQKLQDIIFAGNLNGNGMSISKITIAAKNSTTDYSSFGLFKQIGVELTYDSLGNISNNKLDEDNCSTVKNINFDIEAISATLTRSVGSLTGEVVNSKLYNVKVASENNIVVSGSNFVGGIAGRISGNSFVSGVESSLSVQATYDNQTYNYEYNFSTNKAIYRYAYTHLQDDLNNKSSFVGGLFGVVDIYKTVISSYSQQANANSYYINASIDRTNSLDEEQAHLSFTKVSGDIKLQGDVVGGLFGYVGEGSVIFDTKFELSESNTQNIIADYSAGGIAGESHGFITYAKVELEENKQIDLDKNKDYTEGYLFSNDNNKALYVGGIIGILSNGLLTNSYSKANIIAKNSMYVGSSVGLFNSGNIDTVYTVSYLEAQDQEIQTNGLVTRNKGYAGFIGRINDFDRDSFISSIVSIVKNPLNSTNFNLTTVVGYNSVDGVELTGKCETGVYSDELKTEINSYNGNSIAGGIDGKFNIQYYLDKLSGRFADFVSNNSWIVPDSTYEETYPILIYNKEGSVKSITNEDELRNMLGQGDYKLTKDIYLTKPWKPLETFSGQFSSMKRSENGATQTEIDLHGEYYNIYNLNLDNSVIGTNNVGFFAATSNATIRDITFVVGSRYADAGDPLDFDPSSIMSSWSTYQEDDLGIIADNKSLDSHINTLSLGALSGTAEGGTFTNITIDFKKPIKTNLQNVGGLIGKANKTSLSDITIKGLNINKSAVNAGKILNTHNVSAVIGQGSSLESVNNVTIDTYKLVVVATEDKSDFYTGYYGTLFGHATVNNEISNITITSRAENNASTIYVAGRNTITIGTLAGYLNAKTIKNVQIEKNNSINVLEQESDNSKSISSLTVGGFIGHAEIGEITNVSILEGNNKNIDIKATKSNNEAILNIGGFIGEAEKRSAEANTNSISNIYSAYDLSVELSSVAKASIGGFIGTNGISTSDNGVKIKNVIAKSNLLLKDTTSQTSNDSALAVGGFIGRNYNQTKLENNYYLGKIVHHTALTNYLGGFIGANVGSNITNVDSNGTNQEVEAFTTCYYIEDLALVNRRDADFGTPISYSDFVNSHVKDANSVLMTIINALNSSKDNEDTEKKSLTIDGYSITTSFEEGSIYNPIEINETNILATETNKYYVLNIDLDLTNISTLSESEETTKICGNIMGNGKTITVNKTFADLTDSEALISSFVFKVKEGTREIAGNKYAEGLNTIITKVNNGALFNCAVVGNIYAQLSNNSSSISPVVIENNGFISNVVSNVNLMIDTNIDVNSASKINSTVITGFINKNIGIVKNCVAIGSIEIYNKTYNVNSINKFATNVYGFINEANRFVYENTVAVTLPEKALDNNDREIYNNAYGTLGTILVSRDNYVDIYANGNYKAEYNSNGFNFVETQDETAKIWSDENIGVLYGYKYPVLSVYSVDFMKDAFRTTETFNSKTYYKVNNYGVFNAIFDTLKADDTISEINITQVRSFVGLVSKQEINNGVSENKAQNSYTPKLVNKTLNYLGNGYAINNLNFATKDEDENKLTNVGLFYNTESKFNNAEISINILNLAVTNLSLEYELNVSDINIGAIVATSIASVNLTGCYADGLITTSKQNDLTFVENENKDFVIGGLVGKLVKGEINSSISNIDINLTGLNTTLDDDSHTFYGFITYAGGIVGKVTDTKITNCYSLKDIVVSDSITVNIGGIAGSMTGGELKSNFTLSKVFYSGAYFSYYAAAAPNEDKLTYNVNAIVGQIVDKATVNGVETNFTTALSENKYNSKLNFAKDKNIELVTQQGVIAETSIAEILKSENFVLTNNPFAPQSSGASDSQMVELPDIVKISDTNINLESGKYYVVTLDEGTTVTFNLDNLKQTEGEGDEAIETVVLENTTLIFDTIDKNNDGISQNVLTNVSDTIFDKINNCTIAGLTINVTENSELENAVLAKTIYTTKFYDITVNDAYINATEDNTNNEDNKFGILVNSAENSVISNVHINNGRLNFTEGNKTAYLGGVVGYAKNIIIQESDNSATITLSKDVNASAAYVAGILGVGVQSSIFKCTNTGLIYARNTGNILFVSGIANNNSGNSLIISFSDNLGDIKGVNDSPDSKSTKSVSGVANNAKILYSINKGRVTAIAGGVITANGLGNSTVYYSYNHGNIVSSNEAYALTSGTGYLSYSIGNGYKPDQDGNIPLTKSNNTNYVFDINSIEPAILNGNTKTNAEIDLEKNKFASINDMIADNVSDKEEDEDYYNKKGNLTLVRIRLIDKTKFVLPTDSEGNYLISTPFELWYWNLYGDRSKNVTLLKDIDMTGFSYIPNQEEFTGKFDGDYHTISYLTITPQEYTGFISKSGTNSEIKNINFEDCKVKEWTYSTKKFVEENFVSVVCGFNKGTIQNVLVGAVDLIEEGFIKIDYTDTTSEIGTTNVYIGTISGKNEGKISQCEVINFKQQAVEYSISFTAGVIALAKNLYVYAGGLVGQNHFMATLKDSTYLSVFSGEIFNNTQYFSVPAGDLTWVNDLFFAMYSQTHHYAGKVVGDGSVTSCYSLEYKLEENGETKDQLIHVYTENANGWLVHGATAAKGVAKTALGTKNIINMFATADKLLDKAVSLEAAGKIKKANKILKQAEKLDDIKDLSKLKKLKVFKGVKAGVAGAGLLFSLVQEVNNANSLKQKINTSGEYISNLTAFEYKKLSSAYADIYKSGLYPGQEMFYNNIVKALKEKQSGVEETELTIPLLSGFTDLSMLTSEAREENGNYYVLNAQQLAWALNQDNGNKIVLQDTIDMTKRIWNVEIKGDHDIIFNNFKVVLGANFDSVDAENLRTKLNWNYVKDKEDTSFGYGYFERVSRNIITQAYNNFERAFSKAFAKSYCELTGSSEAGAKSKYLEYINAGYYPIASVTQLKIIADALNTYSTESGEIHVGLNFTDKKFKVIDEVEELDITDTDLSTLDYYNYEFATDGTITNNSNEEVPNYKLYVSYLSGNEIVSEIKTLKEINDGNYELISYSSVIKSPDFVEKFAGKEVILTNSLPFNAEFDGNGKKIITNGSLFNCLDEKAIVKNLNIEVKENTSNELNVDLNVNSFGFVAILNYGTIENISLKLSESEDVIINITYTKEYVDLIQEDSIIHNKNNLSESQIIGDLTLNIGLFTGINSGTISNCKLLNKALTLKSKSTVNFNEKDTGYDYGEKETNVDLNGNGKKEDSIDINLNIEPFASYSKYLNINNNFGLVCGINDQNATIKNISLDGITFNINNELINNINTSNNPSYTNNFGLISGVSEYNANLTDIFVINSKINFDGIANIGTIVGINESNLDKISSFNNVLPNNSDSNIGNIAGLLSPSLIAQNKIIETDEGSEIIEIYTAKYATITNIVSDNVMFGKEQVYKLKKAEEIGGLEGEEIKASYLYDSDNLNEPLYLILYFYNNIADFNISANNYNADNYKGDIDIDFSDVTKEIKFTRTITKNLFDGTNDISNLVSDWGDIDNDNSYMRIFKMLNGSKTILVDKIKNKTIYISNDISSLNNLSMDVDYMLPNDIDGRDSNAEINETTTIKINGINFNVSYKLSATFTDEKVLEINYDAILSEIAVESGKTFKEVFGTDFIIKNLSDLNTEINLDTIITNGNYHFSFESGGDIKTFNVKIS